MSLEGGLDLLSAGGPVIAILAALSVLSVALIVAKALDLRGAVSGGARRAAAIERWHAGDAEGALQALRRGRAPADRVLRFALGALSRGVDRAALEPELLRRGNAEMARMSRHIRTLEVIALVSPLLGLLGTVLGMIEAFRQLELAEGAANASLLAGGIWQALLTTAAGLVVAIPATMAANLLAARVERAGHLIEDGVARLAGPAGAAA